MYVYMWSRTQREKGRRKKKEKRKKMATVFVLLLSFSTIWALPELTVHIVPHTHDDVGWLKTVDQYFYGANNT